MERISIVEQLRSYFAQDILGGNDIGLDETTPLLEWGLINSIEIARLLKFVRKQFAIDIPTDKLTANSFTDIASLTSLILEQMAACS